jgi:hypothetical protein
MNGLTGFEGVFFNFEILAGHRRAGRRVRIDGYGGRVDGYGYGYTGFTRRVRVRRVFSENMLTGPSHACTRVPAYTRIRVQITRVTGMSRRVRIVRGGYKQTSSRKFEKLSSLSC